MKRSPKKLKPSSRFLDRRWSFLGLAAIVLCISAGIPAQAQESLRGKTVTLYVAGGIGGGVDAYARIFIAHLAGHLPGNPTIVASNMPGAGGLQAVQYLYGVAPNDGTALGTFNPGPLTQPFIGKNRGMTQYDLQKFKWIGSLSSTASNCMVWYESPVKSLNDVLHRETTISVTGPDSGGAQLAELYNALLGTKFKIISGYAGAGEALLAVERGEADGTCNSMDSLRATRPEWLRDNKLRMLVQTAFKRDPDYPNVPTVFELIKNDLDRQAFEFIMIPYAIEDPFVLPPGVTPGIVAMYRKAFDETVADPAYLTDSRAHHMLVVAQTGPQVAAMIDKLRNMPQYVYEKIIKATTPH